MPNGINLEYIEEFAGFIRESSENNAIGLVVGGGKISREYIKSARSLGASDFFCDLIGIEMTRLNARILISALGKIASMEPPKNIMDAEKTMDSGKVVVMGGTHPGHTTDGVSAMFSEYIRADLLVIATSVDGVYDLDPNQYSDAKRIERLDFNQLIEISSKCELNAGSSTVVDLIAAKIMKRCGIKTIVLDARDIKNMNNAIDGKKFYGSVIESDVAKTT